jgi:hypothetical protein
LNETDQGARNRSVDHGLIGKAGTRNRDYALMEDTLSVEHIDSPAHIEAIENAV